MFRTPITSRTSVVFEGGGLGGAAWVPAAANTKHVGEDMFYAIRKADRDFAHVLGLDMGKRAPWDDSAFLEHLVELRATRVEALVRESLLEEDERMDADAVIDSATISRLRERLPEVMDVIVDCGIDE